MCKFRDLRADEIDVRVQQAKESGVGLLLYKDARVDMSILDETVGAERWQREHYECKGNLFCRVGIVCETKKGDSIFPEWIWKSDCGTESNTEAQKGEASDSFKRACFNWGIGRELYTSPFIWVKPENCNLKDKKDRNGNVVYSCYDNFKVNSITIENKEITALEIYNVTKKCVAFSWKNIGKKQETKPLTYETALQLVLTEGLYEGFTLKEVYKTDIAYINQLAADNTTPQIVFDAIKLINAKIKEANAK